MRKRVRDMQGRIAKTDNFSINLSPSRCEVRFKSHEQSKYMRELFGFGGKSEKENLTELHKRLTVFMQELQSLVKQVEEIDNG